MELDARIRELLSALDPQSVELFDESDRHVGHAGAASGSSHFRLIIVSPHFRGLDKLERHRMIYSALGPLMHREIHALAIQALAPDEL